MCTGAEPFILGAAGGAGAAATGLTAAEVLTGIGGALSAASALKSLTSSGPKVVDPAEERAKAEALATQNANARLAQRTRALQVNSLATGAPIGKTTFGG